MGLWDISGSWGDSRGTPQSLSGTPLFPVPQAPSHIPILDTQVLSSLSVSGMIPPGLSCSGVCLVSVPQVWPRWTVPLSWLSGVKNRSSPFLSVKVRVLC